MKNIKIVSVVDEFHPNAGYTNNVISKYLVKEGYSYDIVTTQFLEKGNYMDSFDLSNMESKDELFTKTNGVKIHRLSCKKHISGRAVWNYKEFHTKINELKPDILFFGGNDTLIFMQFVLKNRRKIIKNKLPFSIVSDSHMLDMASKNKFKKIFYFLYRLFITPIIKKAKIKVIRVQDDDFVMKRLGVPKDQAPFISFGTDTTVFYPDKVFNREERAKLCLDEKDFVVLYAGKINESKGGMLLSDLICGEYNTSKKIVFIVVANASSDYECRVIERIKRSKNKTIIHPAVSYDQLPYYYKIADLAVFPKQCSLSFYDIQACGEIGRAHV